MEKGVCIFCFDDPVSKYQNFLDVFSGHSFKASLFTQTGAENTPEKWAQYRTLSSAGFEICSHSITHPDLTTLTESQVKAELTGAQNDLVLQNLGNFSRLHTYPYGTYNKNTLEWVSESGAVDAARTGFVTSRPEHVPIRDMLKLQNMSGLGDTSTAAYIKTLVDIIALRKGFGIFGGHRITEPSTEPNNEYEVTYEVMDEVLNYIESLGTVQGMTLGNFLAHYGTGCQGTRRTYPYAYKF
jgi:peptidoglycan/xylan/chitin deacetylase (PgdA/CDA1 family)